MLDCTLYMFIFIHFHVTFIAVSFGLTDPCDCLLHEAIRWPATFDSCHIVIGLVAEGGMLLNTIGENGDMSRTHSYVTATVVVSPVFCVASFSLKFSVLRTCFLVLHQSEDPLLTQCVSFFCSGGVQQTFCCMEFSESA